MIDFDRFLSERESHIKYIAQFFGLEGHETEMLTNPLANRYAKKIEVSYDADFRLKLLQQSKVKYAQEIERGLKWLMSIGQ